MSSARSRKARDTVSETPPGPGHEQTSARPTGKQCESTLDGACERPATWKQLVHAGQRSGAPFLSYAFWCDTHSEAIERRRRQEGLDAGQIERISTDHPQPTPTTSG